MRALAQRLRAMHAARTHHFTPPGRAEAAYAIVATEERLQDLLAAARVLEALEPAPTPVSAADSEGGEHD